MSSVILQGRRGPAGELIEDGAEVRACRGGGGPVPEASRLIVELGKGRQLVFGDGDDALAVPRSVPLVLRF